MVIVVIRHDVGWKYHVVIWHDLITIGHAPDNDIVLVHTIEPTAQLLEHHVTLVARDVDHPVRIGEYMLELEHHHDEVEAGLLAAIARRDEASRLVYADWLEQHEQPARAEFLRLQLEILQYSVEQPEFAAASHRLRALEPMLPFGWRAHLTSPIIQLGDPAQFAFRIGLAHPDLPTRIVQIWAAGVELTCDDDCAHAESFALNLGAQISAANQRLGLPYPELDPVANYRRLEDDDDAREPHRWLDCGPTTDNVSALLFHDGDDAVIAFKFWRPAHPRPHELGQIFVARLPHPLLIEHLRRVIEILRHDIPGGDFPL